MAEPEPGILRWMDELERSPEAAVDDLLRGIADISPYERAGAADALVTIFGALPAGDSRRQTLDDAIASWITSRRGDGPEIRCEYGMNRYIEELIEALTAVSRLRLPGAADRLRSSFASFRDWLTPLSLGRGQDPVVELWRVMASMQTDRRFLKDWYRLCEEAGRSLHDGYFNVGLLGLRLLPEADGSEEGPGGRLKPEVMAGLFRWASLLPPGPASRKAFQHRLAALKVWYPRGPQRWRELILPFFDIHAEAPFWDWIEGADFKLVKPGKPVAANLAPLPPRSRSDDLLRRLTEETTAPLLPEIRALVRDHERYAEATGDAELLVRVATTFSRRLRRQAPRQALRLARLAHRWQPSNPYTWTHWASAFEALGEEDRAEVVYWETVRRFPENPVARVSLSNLLARNGRKEEAEAVLRETVARFPDHAPAVTALAELLAGSGRKEEGEAGLRGAVARFPDHARARVSLADLLAQEGRSDEAEALLREAMARFPEKPTAHNALSRLLLSGGRTDEAETLLRETAARFPDHPVARITLSELLTRSGHAEQAEALFREIIERFPENAVARIALADLLSRGGRSEEAERLDRETRARFRRDVVEPRARALWLLHWNRLDEAEELYQQILIRFGEDGYTRRLAEEIARRRAGWTGWSEPIDSPVESADDTGADGDELSESGADLELDNQLFTNADVSRADLRLRSQSQDTSRQQALARIKEILAADPGHVYPRLVLGLHEAAWRRRMVEEVEAFPRAYPLRFLAARETGSPEEWEHLLHDFHQHRPLTLLGRLAADNEAADPVGVHDLAAWVERGNGSRRGFEALIADRLRRWFGEAPAESVPADLLDYLTPHRAEIEGLVGDGLRRAADEG